MDYEKRIAELEAEVEIANQKRKIYLEKCQLANKNNLNKMSDLLNVDFELKRCSLEESGSYGSYGNYKKLLRFVFQSNYNPTGAERPFYSNQISYDVCYETGKIQSYNYGCGGDKNHNFIEHWFRNNLGFIEMCENHWGEIIECFESFEKVEPEYNEQSINDVKNEIFRLKIEQRDMGREITFGKNLYCYVFNSWRKAKITKINKNTVRITEIDGGDQHLIPNELYYFLSIPRFEEKLTEVQSKMPRGENETDFNYFNRCQRKIGFDYENTL